MKLEVDIQRLAEELERLAGFSDVPGPAVTRILWTENDLAARRYLEGLFTAAGLTVRQDAIGNIFARWQGSEPELPAVGTGSHFDAIPHSGRYDGTLGVLGGLEAVRALRHAGFEPRRSLEILAFTSEEPTRFGLGCLGSRLLSGAMEPSTMRRLKDSEGGELEEIRLAAGCAGQLEDAVLPANYYKAFVELHIEQGPELERLNLPIGIVTAIAAPATLRVQLEGVGGHAGATLMPGRRDALLAGAEISLAVERAALATGAVDTVATTGLFQVHPGAVNSVPSRVLMEIDVRDIDGARRDTVVAAIIASIQEICGRRNIGITLETLNADPPAYCGESVIAAAESACHATDLEYQRMVSRAYHDSLFVARIAPTGMIFIPCRNGVSHRPDEYSSPLQMENGVKVLAGTLARLCL